MVVTGERIEAPMTDAKHIGRAGRVRLADVATAAGVSIATASRALSKPHLVRPDAKDRVADAIKLLNYSPDRIARALSLGRSTTIGAIVPTLGTAVFAEGVECLQNRLDELGYTLLLGNSQYDPNKEGKQIQAFLEYGVAGLLLVAGELSPATLKLIRSSSVPVVATYMQESSYGFPAVGIDNAAATARLAGHLIAIGHRNLAIISNTATPNARSAARRDGAIGAILAAGLTIGPGRVIEVETPSIVRGRSALIQILETCPEVTAVICTTDALAIGALAECRARNLIVPRDLSVTGYDDMELAAQVDPALTTVRIPTREISTRAVDTMMEMIAGRPAEQRVELEAEIVFRDSIAPPRATTLKGFAM
jgi:LacI family transcriptional regulator